MENGPLVPQLRCSTPLLSGPGVTHCDHDSVEDECCGGRSIQAGLELSVDLPSVLSFLSPLVPADRAAAPATNTPDDVPTTLTDEAPTAPDGASASAAGAHDVLMTTVTDTANTADAAHDPDSIRHDSAADSLGGPRDRASRGYGPWDEAEIRRRRRPIISQLSR